MRMGLGARLRPRHGGASGGGGGGGLPLDFVARFLATTFTGAADGAHEVSWPDASAGARNLTSPGGLTYALTVAAVGVAPPYNKPAIYTNGMMQTAIDAAFSAATFSVFFTVWQAGPTDTESVCGNRGVSGSTGWSLRKAGGHYFFIGTSGSDTQVDCGVVPVANHKVGLVYDGVNINVYIDGVLRVSAAVPAAAVLASTPRFTFVGTYDIASGNLMSNEVLVYGRNVSAGERASVDSYFTLTYG